MSDTPLSPAPPATLALEDLKVMVIGDRCWGKGDTVAEARRKARQNTGSRVTRYAVYLVHPESVVTDTGDIEWPVDRGDPFRYRPKLIDKVGLE